MTLLEAEKQESDKENTAEGGKNSVQYAMSVEAVKEYLHTCGFIKLEPPLVKKIRGSQQVEITVTEDDNGTKNMENRLVELHYGPHGWLFGKIFRRGTLLQEYKKDAVNDDLIQNYLHHIKSLNSQESTKRSAREKIIRKAMQND